MNWADTVRRKPEQSSYNKESMTYRLIDHTADFGIHVVGSDLKALFENAADAMFDLIVDRRKALGAQNREIEIGGEDWPDLMVNWLRELLYLWNGNGLIVKRTDIVSISEYNISAIAKVDPYDPSLHDINEEIKAVTYHQISVRPKGDQGWESTIIFDV